MPFSPCGTNVREAGIGEIEEIRSLIADLREWTEHLEQALVAHNNNGPFPTVWSDLLLEKAGCVASKLRRRHAVALRRIEIPLCERAKSGRVRLSLPDEVVRAPIPIRQEQVSVAAG